MYPWKPADAAGGALRQRMSGDAEMLEKQSLLAKLPGISWYSSRLHSNARRVAWGCGIVVVCACAAGSARLFGVSGWSNALALLGVLLALSLACLLWLTRRQRLRRDIDESIVSLIAQCQAIQQGRALRRLVLTRSQAELGPLITALNELLSHLDRIITRQHRFVADAAHELLTPLAAQTVVGQNALARRLTIKQSSEAIGSMLEEADHMERLIDGLLALTRASLPQAEDEQAHREPVDLGQLAGSCVQSLHVLAEEKQQTVSIQLRGPLWSQVDVTMVRQALLNVIHNAIEHCPEGSEIRIETRRDQHDALIVVSDNGPGIAPADQPQVFERFYRGSGSSRRRGLGLGLAIARALLLSQGGRIDLHSIGAGGCRFDLALPLMLARYGVSPAREATDEHASTSFAARDPPDTFSSSSSVPE